MKFTTKKLYIIVNLFIIPFIIAAIVYKVGIILIVLLIGVLIYVGIKNFKWEGITNVYLDEEKIIVKYLLKKSTIIDWKLIKSVTIEPVESGSGYGVARVDFILKIKGVSDECYLFPQKFNQGVRLIEEILKRAPQSSISQDAREFLKRQQELESPVMKKQKKLEIIFIMILFIIWLPASYGFALLLEKLKIWYFTSQLTAGEKFYDLSIWPFLLGSMFLVIIIYGLIMEKVEKLILRKSSSELFDDSTKIYTGMSILGVSVNEKKKYKRFINIFVGVIIFISFALYILTFFWYIKVDNNGLVDKAFYHKTRIYPWNDLIRIVAERESDGDVFHTLYFSDGRHIRLEASLSNQDGKEIAEFASQKMGKPIEDTVNVKNLANNTNPQLTNDINTQSDYSTPEITYESYKKAAKNNDIDGYLDATTKESQDWLRPQTSQLTKIKVEYEGIKNSEYYVEYESEIAILYSKNYPETIPPYYFKKENDLWKIDLIYMRDHIYFGADGKWRSK